MKSSYFKNGGVTLKGSPPTLQGTRIGVMKQKLQKVIVFLSLIYWQVGSAYAEAQSKEEIEFFLQAIGTFLIHIVGPGILVIGIAVAGVSMALGNEQGMRQGALAAGGGALIMLSRAVLDLIQSLTGF